MNWILPLVLVASISPAVPSSSGRALPDSPNRDAVSLRVEPSVVMSPGTVRVTATIAPDDANRRLVLVAESAEYYRSSTTFLEGQSAARSHEMVFKHLPAGTYTVLARVERNDGTTAVDQTTVQVVH